MQIRRLGWWCLAGVLGLQLTVQATQLTVDAGTNEWKKINRHIYGINIANWCQSYYLKLCQPMLTNAGITLVRYGATNIERYNWRNNRMYNVISRTNQYVPTSWEAFVQWVREDLHAEPYLQAAVFAHVASDEGSENYNTNQTLQDITDWVNAAGTNVPVWGVGNEPFIAWKLGGYKGERAEDDESYAYNDGAHGDQIFNEDIAADRFFPQYISIASTIRAANPNAKILGPTPANWWLYWSTDYSPFCPSTREHPGDHAGENGWYTMGASANQWDSHVFPDRAGDPGVIGWEQNEATGEFHDKRNMCQFAKRIGEYATNHNGLQICDYLDFHRYMNTANDATAVQETRDLWDPEYMSFDKETGGSGTKTKILVRFNNIIDHYYTNLCPSLSEYDYFYWQGFPAEMQISALGQMDYLGIFPRQNVQLACNWYIGEPDQSGGGYEHSADAAKQAMFKEDGEPNPKYWALKLMSDHFRDQSVRTESSDNSMFSVYAGLETSSSQLTVVAAYKGQYVPWWEEHHAGDFILDQGNSNATIVVSNFTITGVSKVLRYGRLDPRIVAMAPNGVEVSGNSFTYEFEPLSIYLFQFHGAATPPAEQAPSTYLNVEPGRLDFGPYSPGWEMVRHHDEHTASTWYTTNYTHTLKVINNSNSNTTWQISESCDWLAVVGPTSGVATVTDVIPVIVTNRSMAVGVYSADVHVVTSQGSLWAPVTMEIIPGMAEGEKRFFDAETKSLAHTWNAGEPLSVGFYDIHGNPEDRLYPFIYDFTMDYSEHSALGGLASMRIDFDRSAGDSAGGRLYAAFGTYGHISNEGLLGPTSIWVPTNASPTNYVFKFDIKTKTEGPGFTKTRLVMVITDGDGQKGKPDVGIADFKESMEITDGYWQTVAIPLGTNFFDWIYPGGQNGNLVELNFAKIKQVEFCPWGGREDKKGTMWLDNMRIETVSSNGSHYPVAVARQNVRLIGTNETVTLTGSDSYDPDGSIASWTWSEQAGVADTHAADTTFTPPGAGTYTIELTVADNQGLKSRNPAQVIVNCQPTLFPSDIQLYRDEAMTDEIAGVASNCLDVFVKLVCFAGGVPGERDFTLARLSSTTTYGTDSHNNVNPIQIVLEETDLDSKVFTGRFRLAAFSDEVLGQIAVSEGCSLTVSNNGYFVSRTIGPQTYGLQTVIDHIEDGADKFNAFEGVWNTYDDLPNGNSSAVVMASSPLAANSNSTQSIMAEGTLKLATGGNFNQLFAGVMTKLNAYTSDVAAAVCDLSSTSGYQGISFWLQGNGKRVSVVLKSLAITNYDDYVFTIEHSPTGGWRRYQLLFSDFNQEGWGNLAIERETALRNVNAIQFKFASKADGEFNRIYIDDLSLFGGSKYYLPHAVYNKKNSVSMEDFDGGYLTNKSFTGPGAPGWTLTGNAANEDWGNWRLVLENWTGTNTGSAWQDVTVEEGQAYQFSVKAWKNAAFNGRAYIEMAWYNASSLHLGTDSLDITDDLTESAQAFTLTWRWAPDTAAKVRVRLRTDSGIIPPYADNAVQFDDAEFAKYGFVADNGWIGNWIAGSSLDSSTNRAEGNRSLVLKTTSSDWLGGMFVAPYDTGETRTNFSAFSGLALKACRPAGFTNTGTAAGRIRFAVAVDENPVARTRWYSVGASEWEDYILFPKSKFLTTDTVDTNDPSLWVVWSGDWSNIRRVIIEYGPSREAAVPYHVLVDDFRPYSDTYVPDDIVDDPITNSTATMSAFPVLDDAGIPEDTGLQVVEGTVTANPNWVGESPPEGSSCLRIQSEANGTWAIEYTQRCAVVASLALPGQAWNIDISGSYAYLAAADQGLRIVNIGNPLAPVETASVALPQYARDVKVVGNYAYVASVPFKIFNVSDPAHPAEVGSIDIGSAFSVEVEGSHAYVVRRDNRSALAILNVSDPAHPVLQSEATVGSIDCHVKISNNYAYVALQDTGFHVVNVADKDHPVILTTNRLLYAMGVDLSGSYAYVGGYGGLTVFDIGNPAAPVQVGSLAYSGYTREVKIVGTRAYVTGDRQLRIVDISTPSHPVLVGYSDNLGSYSYGVEVVGNIAYVADYAGGLKVVDVSTDCDSVDLADYVDGFLKFWVKSPADLSISMKAGGLEPSAKLSGFNWSGANEWEEVVIPLRSLGFRADHLDHTFKLFQCRPVSADAAVYFIDNIRFSNQY
ncbi:MAG TPA: hypothetical protein DCZ95_16495 [Verrucomicrobia bacterium]|nr:MAG: hypothetical protein A2X46_15665 [Lentisphaerae bacterium GWF2_57_35]HBA85682.1 hypothetical protein [Verrucomicrobiota bacterium]